MKFLVDAQLPRRLIYRLRERGHDAIHNNDLERIFLQNMDTITRAFKKYRFIELNRKSVIIHN
jgi:predicted nuclease of predicted toxin-antitoxin system